MIVVIDYHNIQTSDRQKNYFQQIDAEKKNQDDTIRKPEATVGPEDVQ